VRLVWRFSEALWISLPVLSFHGRASRLAAQMAVPENSAR
jgi:hypothetical protein